MRELLILQSVYACRSQSDITDLVGMQPSPTIFFKVFLELGINSMLPYLAFDSNSIRELLADGEESKANHEYFEAYKEYPLFFRGRDARTAVDVALDYNQIGSVEEMLRYICKY